MALTPSGARVRSLVSARESKRVELTSSVLTYNTLKPGSRLFQRLAWPRRIKHWSAGGRCGHMPHSLPLPLPSAAVGRATGNANPTGGLHPLLCPSPHPHEVHPAITPTEACTRSTLPAPLPGPPLRRFRCCACGPRRSLGLRRVGGQRGGVVGWFGSRWMGSVERSSRDCAPAVAGAKQPIALEPNPTGLLAAACGPVEVPVALELMPCIPPMPVPPGWVAWYSVVPGMLSFTPSQACKAGNRERRGTAAGAHRTPVSECDVGGRAPLLQAQGQPRTSGRAAQQSCAKGSTSAFEWNNVEVVCIRLHRCGSRRARRGRHRAGCPVSMLTREALSPIVSPVPAPVPAETAWSECRQPVSSTCRGRRRPTRRRPAAVRRRELTSADRVLLGMLVRRAHGVCGRQSTGRGRSEALQAAFEHRVGCGHPLMRLSVLVRQHSARVTQRILRSLLVRCNESMLLLDLVCQSCSSSLPTCRQHGGSRKQRRNKGHAGEVTRSGRHMDGQCRARRPYAFPDVGPGAEVAGWAVEEAALVCRRQGVACLPAASCHPPTAAPPKHLSAPCPVPLARPAGKAQGRGGQAG